MKFVWTPGVGALEYWLELGTGFDSLTAFTSSTQLNQFQTVTTVPTNGAQVAVRLWTRFSSGWISSDCTYTAAFVGLVRINNLPPGAVLPGTSATFEWSAGLGVLEYKLEVGKALGGHEYATSSTGLVRSLTVNGLPTDSSQVFVRLSNRTSAGTFFHDEVYRADQSELAAMITPIPQSTLPTGSVTFTWTAGTNAQEYYIRIYDGSAREDFALASTGMNRSFTTSLGALPLDGTPVFVRLWTRLPSGWGTAYRDYSYTAATGVRAEMISPSGGSTLPSSSVTFTWTAGSGASAYYLYAGTTPGAFDLFNQNTGTQTTQQIRGLPQDGRVVYVRLFTLLGNKWLFQDYPYFTTGFNAVIQLPVNLRSVARFAVLAGSTVTSTGFTQITGDIGLDPGSAVTGFPPGGLNGTLFTAGPTAATAQLDLTTAFNDAAGRSTGPVGLSGNMGGLTLPPGLYKSTSSLEISSGDLTLDGKGDPNAVFIFQIASTLTTSSGRKVILIGGAQAANITWQVGTSVTIGTNSILKGTILCDQSISLLTGASLQGRAATRIAAVTMDTNVITLP